jgi:hypothetical protein
MRGVLHGDVDHVAAEAKIKGYGDECALDVDYGLTRLEETSRK